MINAGAEFAMTDKPTGDGGKQRDRFWRLDLPDLIEAIDELIRVTWLMLRVLWWLAGLIFRKGGD